MDKTEHYSPGVAFALWLACLFGACGIHRFYLGRPVSGLIYLFTFGLLGIGQLVDLIRLRGIVDDQNLIARGRSERALAAGHGMMRALPPATPSAPRPSREELRQALLKAAAARGGALSVTQGVLATGADFEVVEAALDEMAKKGYADIDNDPQSGVVVYRFGDLA